MSFARVRALAVVGILVVAAAVFVTIALIKDRQTRPDDAKGCGEGAVVVDLKLPVPESVTLNVYNATDKPGLANEIKSELVSRKFKVEKVGDDPLKKRVNGVAVIRFGPKAVGNAWLVRAYFLDEADTEFDKGRQDDKVDIVLGTKFLQLATTTEVKQALAQLGNPTLPEGTCASEE